jgi:glycosyltransferase involved in cell wall biosynthesis
MNNILPEVPEVYLLICGTSVESNQASTQYFEMIKHFVVANQLSDSVRLLGWRSDIRDLYQQSDIYISTSYSESFPDAVREGMLASLPVIVTDVGGTNELVEVKKNGFLFEPGDCESLTRHILLLLKNREIRVRMGRESKKIIESRFSNSAYAKSFESMVAQLFR